MLHNDGVSARVLSNHLEVAMRINGMAKQLLLFISLSLMFPWFDIKGEVFHMDLGASYQIFRSAMVSTRSMPGDQKW